MDRSEKTRLDDLEILAAHQSKMLDDINEIVIEQGKVIAEMRRKVEVLSGRLEDIESDANVNKPTQKPPHW